MTSSKEDDPENKALALLHQIRRGLETPGDEETAEERADRLEVILQKVSDVLTLYGANVFTLAVHQVQIIKQLTEVEEYVRAKMTGKMLELPHFRQKAARDDPSN